MKTQLTVIAAAVLLTACYYIVRTYSAGDGSGSGYGDGSGYG